MKKTTEELLKILKNTPDMGTYLSQEKDNINTIVLAEYLQKICKQKNVSKAQCIKQSGLDRNYAYQVFSGTKYPARDKVLALCFGLSLSLDEIQNLLKTTGYPILYAKNKRDSVIIFAVQRGYSIINVNELLYEMGMELVE